MPSFSIITPTIGRPTLAGTLESVVCQRGPYDEHIIVSDGVMPSWVKPDKQTILLETERTGGYGATQRDAGIAAATGDYLLFVDDDDAFLPGVFDMIRGVVADSPGAMLLFRMLFNGYGGSLPDGTVLWRDKTIRDGNVSTGMIVCPRLPDMPKWGRAGVRTYNCDYWFVVAMAERTKVLWRQEVIQQTRPASKTW